MPANNLRRKQGVVILLDALGASSFSDDKIKKFLAARAEINAMIAGFANSFPRYVLFSQPSLYTFGDTIIITLQFRGKKNYAAQIARACLVMRRYLFHSLEQGILFRGAFSIGTYIEDGDSNTVMGEAITDAAQWYEQADWMGIASTPRTNTAIEYYLDKSQRSNPRMLCNYPVPIKGGKTLNLYTIPWPSAFYDPHFLKLAKKKNSRTWFLERFKDFSFPIHATAKYENSKQYFDYIENEVETLREKEVKKAGASAGK